jgi:hypothetical protein
MTLAGCHVVHGRIAKHLHFVPCLLLLFMILLCFGANEHYFALNCVKPVLGAPYTMRLVSMPALGSSVHVIIVWISCQAAVLYHCVWQVEL